MLEERQISMGWKQELCFALIKKTLCTTFVLPTFDRLFEVDCNVNGVGIEIVLSQKERPLHS